jgi:hypothetical protein
MSLLYTQCLTECVVTRPAYLHGRSPMAEPGSDIIGNTASVLEHAAVLAAESQSDE